jgi:hypothetical protein
VLLGAVKLLLMLMKRYCNIDGIGACQLITTAFVFLNLLLNEQDSDITYTQTDKAWTWKTILSLVREDDRFYQDTGKHCY